MSLFGSTLRQLENFVIQNNFPRYQALTLFQTIYKNSKTAIGLPKNLKTIVEKNSIFHECQLESKQTSKDGTQKFLTKLSDNSTVETVIIPDSPRITACISSQVGCSLSCTFCHTGSQKFKKNLTTHEILAQIVLSNTLQKTTNIVFMGQGEPLYNYKNVKSAIEILSHRDGFEFSKTRITLSTSGISPLIPSVANELGVNLAVSLHAPNNDLRSRLMAINKTYPLEILMDSLKEFSKAAPCSTKQITFEYLMLDNINDTDSCAKDIVRLAKQLPSIFVNLIPWNPWPGSPIEFVPSSNERINMFKDFIESSGIPVAIRKTRGDDILAACGQLKSIIM